MCFRQVAAQFGVHRELVTTTRDRCFDQRFWAFAPCLFDLPITRGLWPCRSDLRWRFPNLCGVMYGPVPRRQSFKLTPNITPVYTMPTLVLLLPRPRFPQNVGPLHTLVREQTITALIVARVGLRKVDRDGWQLVLQMVLQKLKLLLELSFDLPHQLGQFWKPR